MSYRNIIYRDSSGGSMVKTSSSQCRRQRFHLWSGNQTYTAQLRAHIPILKIPHAATKIVMLQVRLGTAKKKRNITYKILLRLLNLECRVCSTYASILLDFIVFILKFVLYLIVIFSILCRHLAFYNHLVHYSLVLLP